MSELPSTPTDNALNPRDQRFLARAQKCINRHLDRFFAAQREAVACVRHDSNDEEMGSLADAVVDLFEEVLRFVPPVMRPAVLASLMAEWAPGDQEIQHIVDRAAGIYMGHLLRPAGTQVIAIGRMARAAADLSIQARARDRRQRLHRTGALGLQPMHGIDAYRVVQRRAAAIGLEVAIGCHTLPGNRHRRLFGGRWLARERCGDSGARGSAHD